LIELIKIELVVYRSNGSGWIWLVQNLLTGELETVQTENNDQIQTLNPNFEPLLNIDLWYAFDDCKNEGLKYQDEVWKNVDWNIVA
jgi:superoxide dismutase